LALAEGKLATLKGISRRKRLARIATPSG